MVRSRLRHVRRWHDGAEQRRRTCSNQHHFTPVHCANVGEAHRVILQHSCTVQRTRCRPQSISRRCHDQERQLQVLQAGHGKGRGEIAADRHIAVATTAIRDGPADPVYHPREPIHDAHLPSPPLLLIRNALRPLIIISIIVNNASTVVSDNAHLCTRVSAALPDILSGVDGANQSPPLPPPLLLSLRNRCTTHPSSAAADSSARPPCFLR